MSVRNRPLSPHVTIYRLPLLAKLSISHRITGVGLVLGLFVLAWWLGAVASGPESYAVAQAVVSSFLGRLVLMGFSAALFFHLSNGLRHLLWDTGKGFDLAFAQKSNTFVLGSTAVLTLVAWLAIIIL